MTAVMAFGMIPAQELCAAEETQKKTQAALRSRQIRTGSWYTSA